MEIEPHPASHRDISEHSEQDAATDLKGPKNRTVQTAALGGQDPGDGFLQTSRENDFYLEFYNPLFWLSSII